MEQSKQARKDDMLKVMLSQQQHEDALAQTAADREATRNLTQQQIDHAKEAQDALNEYRTRDNTKFDANTFVTLGGSTSPEGQAYKVTHAPETYAPVLAGLWGQVQHEMDKGKSVTDPELAPLMRMWSAVTKGDFNPAWVGENPYAPKKAPAPVAAPTPGVVQQAQQVLTGAPEADQAMASMGSSIGNVVGGIGNAVGDWVYNEPGMTANTGLAAWKLLSSMFGQKDTTPFVPWTSGGPAQVGANVYDFFNPNASTVKP